jgi:peptidyl-prolyl cis-trans isomerase C
LPLPAPGAPAARRDPLAGLFDDPVIARGKGVVVKQSQLDDSFIAFKANLAAQNRTVPEPQRLAREAQLLDRLIVTQLLTNRASAEDRTLAVKLAGRFTAGSIREAGSEDDFFRQLRAVGLTREQFEARVAEQSLAEAVIDRELKSGLTISDAQIKEFYDTGADYLVRALEDELQKLIKDPAASIDTTAAVKARIDQVKKANLSRLDQPEQVRVLHVLRATRHRQTEEELPEAEQKAKRAEIEKIRTRALAGDDFAKLVMENSEDRGLAQTKGEYTFSREDPFVPEFRAAAFSLKPGQISDVVTTRFGYHVLKLLERIPAKKVEFDKAAPDIKEFLHQQAVQKAMPAFFDKLKKDAGVEILEAKYRIVLPEETDPRKPGL